MENTVASLDYYKRLFAESRDLCEDGRKESRIDDDYYHGYQLTREERLTLQKRGQPDGIFNRVRKAVNGTLGVLKQGATDPRAWPRNPQDEDAAEVATKVLRYVADTNRFDARRIDAAFDYLGPGTCAAIIEVDDEGKPTYGEIHWEEFFYDARSRKPDFRDAKHMGIAKWMYAADIEAMWPDAKREIDIALSADAVTVADATFEDRPNDKSSSWVDIKRRRLMVVELYCRKGAQWERAVFYSGGWLVQPEPSPYVRRKGKRIESVCPIVAQSCYVDRENNRYGIIRDMRAPQDDFNKRRQKLLHMLNNRQVQAVNEIAYEADAETVRREAAKADGVLPPGWQPTSVNDLAAGQFNLLTLAEGEMDREGPNPAVLARGGESASGRAQMVRQQAGLTEQAVIFGGFEDWEHRVYEAFWDRCVQFMQQPEWIRITDDQGASQFLQVNEPVMGPPQVVMSPDGMPQLQPTVLGYRNRLVEMDVDISLDTVPDTANLAQEQFLALVDLARSGVPIDPMMLLEASSLPKKREIMEKLQQGQGQPNPMQEIAMQDAAAKVEKTKSEAGLNIAKIGQIQGEMQMSAFETGAQAGFAGMPAAGA